MVSSSSAKLEGREQFAKTAGFGNYAPWVDCQHLVLALGKRELGGGWCRLGSERLSQFLDSVLLLRVSLKTLVQVREAPVGAGDIG